MRNGELPALFITYGSKIRATEWSICLWTELNGICVDLSSRVLSARCGFSWKYLGQWSILPQ